MIAVSVEFVSVGVCSSSCFGISLLGRLSISLGSAACADSDLVVIGIPFYSNDSLFNFKCDWVGGSARRAFIKAPGDGEAEGFRPLCPPQVV